MNRVSRPFGGIRDAVMSERYTLRRLAVVQDKKTSAENAAVDLTRRRKRVSGANRGEYLSAFLGA